MTKIMKNIITRLPENRNPHEFRYALYQHDTDHVRQQNYDIAIESSYKLSNEREIHDELIKQAVANSKHRAEAIATTVGKKSLVSNRYL